MREEVFYAITSPGVCVSLIGFDRTCVFALRYCRSHVKNEQEFYVVTEFAQVCLVVVSKRIAL